MREISIGKTVVGDGSTTTVYTIPTGYYAKWNLAYLFNATGNTKTVTMSWYDASASTTYDILNGYSLSSKDFLKFDGGAYIVLEEGDQVTFAPESGATFTILTTFELIGSQRA